MNRFLFENLFGIQGLNIAWYGVIIACALMIGMVLAMQHAKLLNFPQDTLSNFMTGVIPVAIIGARLYYVVFSWDIYRSNLLKIFAIWEGGLAIYGGILATALYAIFFCHKNKVSFLSMADIIVPSLALGQCMGRWGNFFNQEAYGNLVTNKALQFFPYAVFIDEQQAWFQATFFYESLFNLLLFFLLFYLIRHRKFSGQVMSIYLIGYGIARFFIEGLRSDSLYLLGVIRVSQLVSILMIIIGLIIYIKQKRK